MYRIHLLCRPAILMSTWTFLCTPSNNTWFCLQRVSRISNGVFCVDPLLYRIHLAYRPIIPTSVRSFSAHLLIIHCRNRVCFSLHIYVSQWTWMYYIALAIGIDNDKRYHSEHRIKIPAYSTCSDCRHFCSNSVSTQRVSSYLPAVWTHPPTKILSCTCGPRKGYK